MVRACCYCDKDSFKMLRLSQKKSKMLSRKANAGADKDGGWSTVGGNGNDGNGTPANVKPPPPPPPPPSGGTSNSSNSVTGKQKMERRWANVVMPKAKQDDDQKPMDVENSNPELAAMLKVLDAKKNLFLLNKQDHEGEAWLEEDKKQIDFMQSRFNEAKQRELDRVAALPVVKPVAKSSELISAEAKRDNEFAKVEAQQKLVDELQGMLQEAEDKLLETNQGYMAACQKVDEVKSRIGEDAGLVLPGEAGAEGKTPIVMPPTPEVIFTILQAALPEIVKASQQGTEVDLKTISCSLSRSPPPPPPPPPLPTGSSGKKGPRDEESEVFVAEPDPKKQKPDASTAVPELAGGAPSVSVPEGTTGVPHSG